MTTDILGVRKDSRSRVIVKCIATALLAECEADLEKEIEIRERFAEHLATTGVLAKHVSWKQAIISGNNHRLEILHSGASRLTPEAMESTHVLAHSNWPDPEMPDCAVCKWAPLPVDDYEDPDDPNYGWDPEGRNEYLASISRAFQRLDDDQRDPRKAMEGF